MRERDLDRRLRKAEERLRAAAASERERSLDAYRADLSALAAEVGWRLDWAADEAARLATPAAVRAYFYAGLAAHARRPADERADGEEQGDGDHA